MKEIIIPNLPTFNFRSWERTMEKKAHMNKNMEKTTKRKQSNIFFLFIFSNWLYYHLGLVTFHIYRILNSILWMVV